MKKYFFLLFIILSEGAWAQKQMTQKEIIRFLKGTEDALVNLSREIPENKYEWKPNESVRNIGQIILHVAGGNYYILMNLGIAPPSDINLMSIENIQGKDKVISTLSTSFKFIYNNLLSIKDKDLASKVKFPFGEMTKEGALLQLVDHTGEHKGQLIAYARSIGVAPPWSK